MITKQDCEIMYYLPPIEYQALYLGEDRYPDWRPNFKKEQHLETLLVQCSKGEFLKTLVDLFIEKYPNAWSLWSITMEKDPPSRPFSPTLGRAPSTFSPVRTDIDQMKFNFKNTNPIDDQFLDDLRIVFKQPAPDIAIIVLQNIQSKPFQTTMQGATVVHTIQSSPIARIEINGNTVHFFYNKAYYIDEYRYC